MKKIGTVSALSAFIYLVIRLSAAFLAPLFGEEASPVIDIAANLLSVCVCALFLFFFSYRGARLIDIGQTPRILPRGKAWPGYLIFLPLFLTITIGLAALSSLLADLLGLNRAIDISGPLPYQIFAYAFIPALTEEFLCRFLILRPLAAKNKVAGVLLSSLLFAAMHMNFAQIPYAFFGGLILAALALATDSLIIPFLFHFVNNLSSVLLVYFAANVPAAVTVVYAVFILSLIFSLLYLVCFGWMKRDGVLLVMKEHLLPSRQTWCVVGDTLLSPYIAPVIFCFVMAVLP